MQKDDIPYGSDVSGGAFECVDCGYGLQMASADSLPPCPKFDASHDKKAWRALYGRGDAKGDPQS